MNEDRESGMGNRESGMQKPQADAAIRAEGLAKTYAEGKMRTPVFDGLELSVAAGETVAIVGASGAGKSTLLHLLGGLGRADLRRGLRGGAAHVGADRRGARTVAQPLAGLRPTSSITCCPSSPRWRT